MRDVRRWVVDPAIVLLIAVFTAVVAQRWTGLDTPDSSFYATLGVFGDEVTDRAHIQSYYWTRLGVITPVRVLTSLFGVWPGYAIYRFLLILVIVASLYIALRVFTSRRSSTALTAMLMMNTVLLGYLGNPYVTGTALAGTSVVITSSLFRRTAATVLGGVALGWLAMTHPPAALLAGSIWIAMWLHAALRDRTRPRLSPLLVAAVSAAVTFGAFLVVGRFIFPEMNWFETYLTWNAKLHYSDFASRDPVWLQDISLLVPALVLVAAAGVWLSHRRDRWAELPLLISATSIGFVLVFNPIMGGVALEAPMYQAALWVPALMSFGILAAGRIADAPWRPITYVVAVVGLAGVILAGHWPGAMALWAGFVLAVAVVVMIVVVFELASRPGPAATAVVVLAVAALTLSAAQLLQNSRRSLGLYYLSPYANAFNANPISDKIHTAVNAEEWLLSVTEPSDRILSWVDGDWVGGDRELYVVAAMQLWGENRVTLEKTLTPEDVARLETIRPTVIQMVGPTMDGIAAFAASIPDVVGQTPLQCYDFAWPNPDIPQGHSCVTHLSWPVG